MHLLTHLIEMSLSGPLRVDTRFLGMCCCYCCCCCCKSLVAQVNLEFALQPKINMACTSDAPRRPPISTSHLVYAVLETRARASYGSGITLAAELCSSPGSSVYVFSVSQQYKHSWENPQDCPNTQLFNLTCLKIKCISKSR